MVGAVCSRYESSVEHLSSKTSVRWGGWKTYSKAPRHTLGWLTVYCGEQGATRQQCTGEPHVTGKFVDALYKPLPKWKYDALPWFQLTASPQNTCIKDKSPQTRMPGIEQNFNYRKHKTLLLAHPQAFIFTLFSMATAISDISHPFFLLQQKKIHE